MDRDRIADILEIQDLTARYAEHLSRDEADLLVDLFTPDGIYYAFGTAYSMEELPGLIASAPRGQLIINPEVLELDGDEARGTQHYCYIDQHSHDMRLAWYTDEFRKTDDGWRFTRRSTTFMRRSGGADAGKADDPGRFEGGQPSSS